MGVKDERGYSLVEILVAIAIMAIVGGAVCGFLLTSGNLFNRSRNEVDLQTEAQVTANWLNDLLSEAGYGVSYRETTQGDGTQLHILEVYNDNTIYTITYHSGSGRLVCDEGRLKTEDGAYSIEVVSSDNLLAEYVTEFKVDLTQTTEENPVVTLVLKMEKNGNVAELVRTIHLRNGVKIDRTLAEVYSGSSVMVSSATGVVIYPQETKLAKGGSMQFTARVTGVGFPSQHVSWAIWDGTELKTQLESGTVIDADGRLTISSGETAATLRVVATSVEKDTDGNNVSSTENSGNVTIVTITGIVIAGSKEPGEKYSVGTLVPLTAIVVGSGIEPDDTIARKVTWSIREEDKKKGFSITSDGVVTLGMQLYNDPAFDTVEERKNASVRVYATSVVDPTVTQGYDIPLDFDSVDLSFGAQTYIAERNGQLDLYSKLVTGGITGRDMKLIWNLTDDAGLGNKVSLDNATGILTIEKNIDYTKEFRLKVQVSVYASGTADNAMQQEVWVVLPKVSISFGNDTCQVVKGTSTQMPFIVNGLNVTAEDLQITSTPAIRNTLLYVQGSNLTVSVGKDVKKDKFGVTLSLRDASEIYTAGTVLIQDEILSDDEIRSINNVQDMYFHIPVPGEENNAPSLEKVTTGGAEIVVDGIRLNYSYDAVRKRCKVQIDGIDNTYFYVNVAGSDIKWYKNNSDQTDGACFYAPVPGEKVFPTNFVNDEASIIYRGEKITYKGYEHSGYTQDVNTVIPVYQVYDPETDLWFQYNNLRGIWQTCKETNKARNGVATAQSQLQSAGNAIDGDRENTRWESEWGYAQDWLTIDLGSVYRFQKIDIYWENARAKEWKILISNDGKAWREAGAYSRDDGQITDNITLSAVVAARYVRIYGTAKRLDAYGYSIYEVEIPAWGFKLSAEGR